MDSPLPAPGFEGVDLSRRTDWRKLTKLECIEKPGLTEEQFLGLFVVWAHHHTSVVPQASL